MNKSFFLILLPILILTMFTPTALCQAEKGPRIDELLIKMLPYDWSQIDIASLSVNPNNPPPGAVLEQYVVSAMVDIEINNNRTIPRYSDWTSPTWDFKFRQAISHLADKETYINEILNGYAIVLNTPVMPWLKKWHNPDAPKYEYSLEIASQKLDAAGYTMGLTGLRVYPPWHEKAGQPLDPLIFYVRADRPEMIEVAQRFTNALTAVGIPVNLVIGFHGDIYQKVFIERDYHLYIGAWSLPTRTPEYLYGLYHTNPSSKDLISDPELDYWLELLKSASDEPTAIMAAFKAQDRLLEIAATIPLWAPIEVKAYREGWAGVINENGTGIDNWWTFINTWPTHMEKPWTLRYGIGSSDLDILNPIFSYWFDDWTVLSKIYDQLIRENPYDPSQDISWIAESWEVTTWTDPDDLQTKTKLIFHLNKGITWHPRELPVVTPLTSADVKFTIEYLKNYTDSWNHPLVMDVHHVETPDEYTVIVYENVLSYWTLYYIGALPILPRHV